MASTNMNPHIIEQVLENVDEAMFAGMSNFALEKENSISEFKDLKNEIDKLLSLLPDSYTPQNKEEFIETFNNILM